MTRRNVLVGAGIGTVLLTTGMVTTEAASAAPANAEPFGYCLNTSTIRGQKLSLIEEMEIAAKAGYSGLEPWVNELQEYANNGGSLSDLKKRATDLGLTIENAIAFADWANDDDAKRAQGVEEWQRNAEIVAAIGGRRIAAPPNAGYEIALDLRAVADRYRHILALGREIGVVPQLEMWGSSKTMSRMSELSYVLIETAQPDACGLLDAYHIYRGGSDFAGLRFFNGANLHVFHVNDYPADPPREKLSSPDRVYPGNGICPLVTMLRDLVAIGFRGMLSLELFNQEYWKQDALVVARTGLEKIRALVQQAMQSGANNR